MIHNRPARLLWLFISLMLLFTQLAGCAQAPTPTQIAAVQATATLAPSPTVTSSKTPAPTRTRTPKPSITVTRTSTPTNTSTPNIRETFLSLTEAVAKTDCTRHPNTWQVTVERSLRGGWCQAAGTKGSLYEYQVFYPSGWSVKAFGELYPHLLFISGKPNIDLRLYQVFSYYTHKEHYPLEESAARAAFYDVNDKPFPVVKAGEKIIKSERRTTFNRDIMVVDSQLGDYAIRRYFLFITMQPGLKPVKNLFYFELTTLKTLDPQAYQDLVDKTEYMLTTLAPVLQITANTTTTPQTSPTPSLSQTILAATLQK